MITRTVTRTKGYYRLEYQVLYYGSNLVTTDNFLVVSWVYTSQLVLVMITRTVTRTKIADQK